MPRQQNYEILDANFFASADTPEKIKTQMYPEVAFVGRSNVGKSTLLNVLCRQKGLARVSKMPGRTRSFNYFDVEYRKTGSKQRTHMYFVDLPGYGYAKVGRELQRLWASTIADYIESRRMLKNIILLVDIRRELEGEENWVVERASLPHGLTVVLTKSDKLSRGAAEARRRAVAKELSLPLGQVFLSALKTDGDEKQKVLDHIIGSL